MLVTVGTHIMQKCRPHPVVLLCEICADKHFTLVTLVALVNVDPVAGYFFMHAGAEDEQLGPT